MVISNQINRKIPRERREGGGTTMEDHEQTTEERPVMRIWPKKIDVIIVAAIGTLCLGFLIAMHWDLSRSDLVLIASMFLAYMLILAFRACQ